MNKLEKLLNDARLHVNESENKIRSWQIKHEERLRQVLTIEIIMGEDEKT